MKKILVLSLLCAVVSVQASLQQEQEQCAKDLVAAMKNDDLRAALEVVRKCQEASGQEPAQINRALYQAASDSDQDAHNKLVAVSHRGIEEGLSYEQASRLRRVLKQIKYFHNDHTLFFYGVPVAVAAVVVAGVAVLAGQGAAGLNPGGAGGTGANA